MEPTGYRKVIIAELNKKKERNAKYSLRAFARDLKVEPALIARVLNGTRNLSMLSAKKIAHQLFSNSSLRAHFLSLVEMEITEGAKASPAQIAEKVKVIDALQAEAFQIEKPVMEQLVSWVYFAILDLLTLKEAPQTPADIGRYLDVEAATVQKAIKVLLAQGLVIETPKGLQKKTAMMFAPNGIPSEVGRAYHRQMIARGVEALETQPIDRRYFYGETIAIKQELYGQLKEITDEYFAKVSELAQISEGQADRLYQVNVQVYDHRKES